MFAKQFVQCMEIADEQLMLTSDQKSKLVDFMNLMKPEVQQIILNKIDNRISHRKVDITGIETKYSLDDGSAYYVITLFASERPVNLHLGEAKLAQG